jgi:hypothetical protein
VGRGARRGGAAWHGGGLRCGLRTVGLAARVKSPKASLLAPWLLTAANLLHLPGVQYPELPAPVVGKLLGMEANELDMILQYPKATQLTVGRESGGCCLPDWRYHYLPLSALPSLHASMESPWALTPCLTPPCVPP